MPVATGTGFIDRLAADLEGQGHAAGTAAAIALNTARQWGKDTALSEARRTEARAAVKVVERRADVNRSTVAAHATPEELRKVGEKAAHRLAVTEGLSATLTDPEAKHGMAYASAKALLEGAKVKVSLTEPEPYAEDLAVVQGRLAEEIDIDAFLAEATVNLRTKGGQFHGMHGMETRGNKGKLLKGEGAAKCEHCGAIKPSADATCPKGGDHKKLTEADAENPVAHFAPDIEFDPAKHPRDHVGKFTAIIKSLVPDMTLDGVHHVDLPSGVTVQKTALGGKFWVTGKNARNSKKFKDAETAALAALLADKMGGKVLTEAEYSADQYRLKLVEVYRGGPNGNGQTGPTVANPGAAGAAMPKAGAKQAKGRGGGAGAGAAKAGAKKAKGRDGKTPGNSNFEQQHPRGRGGVWIKKGDGSSSNPNPQVANLQRRLHQLGYGPGADDGAYGDLTAAAVAKFQADYGLKSTGEVDPATLQTLQSPPAQKLADVQAANAAAAAAPNAQGIVPGGSSTGAGAAGTHARSTTTQASSLDPSNPDSIKQFQAAHGLAADGVIGPATQEAIRTSNQSAGTSTHAGRSQAGKTGHTGTGKTGHSAAGAPNSPASGAVLKQGEGMDTPSRQVKDVQKALDDLGYDLGSGGVDGKFGPDTKRAIEKLQRQHGLKVDGIYGPETEKLVKHLGKRAQKPRAGVQSADASMQQSRDRLHAAEDLRDLCERTGDVEGYVRARLDVVRQRRELEEFLGRGGKVVDFDPNKHPRNREGKFREILGGLKVGEKVKLPDGAEVHKTAEGFEVHPKGGIASKAPNVDKAIERVKGDADWRSPQEQDAAVSSDAEKIAALAHGKSMKVNGATVRRSHLGGYYVNDEPVKAADVLAATKVGLGQKARKITRTEQDLAAVRRRRVLAAAREVSMSDTLHVKLEEAVADRFVAEYKHDTAAFTEARARENALIEQVIEARGARERHAAIVVEGRPMFPIEDREDALVALRLLGRRKLTEAQRQQVVDIAAATLLEADVVVEGVGIMVGEVSEAMPCPDCLDVTEAKYGRPGYVGTAHVGVHTGGQFDDMPNARIQRRDNVDSHGISNDPKKRNTKIKVSCPSCGANFDPSKHPRTRTGTFATTGSSGLASVSSGVGSATTSPRKRQVREAADSMAKASSHEQVGHGGKNWITSMGEQLPAYIQHIANDLMEKRGKTESNAVQMAIGIVKRWAKGAGDVQESTRAAAAKAVAEWEALKAKNKAKSVAEAEAEGDGNDDESAEHTRMKARLKKKGVPEAVAHKMATKALNRKKIAETLQIEEAGLAMSGARSNFDPVQHPRGRHGQFVDVLRKLKSGVDVTLPHGTKLHAMDGVRNRYTVSDSHGARHVTYGGRFTAAWGIAHDRRLPPLPKASPSVKKGVEHFPAADSTNQRFVANKGHLSPPVLRPAPLAAGETTPDIHRWPRDPSEVPQFQAGIGHRHSWKELPQSTGNYHIPSHSEILDREYNGFTPGQREWLDSHPVGPPKKADGWTRWQQAHSHNGSSAPLPETPGAMAADAGHAYQVTGPHGGGGPRRAPYVPPKHVGSIAPEPETPGAMRAVYGTPEHLAQVQHKFQNLSDADLHTRMSAIKDPITYGGEVRDITTELRRRQGGISARSIQARALATQNMGAYGLAEAVGDGSMQPSENAVPTRAIQAVTDPDEVKVLSLAEIAANIAADWGPSTSFSAMSYLDAMRTARDQSQPSGRTSPMVPIVRHFLQNAAGWSGPVADVVKPELARRLRLAEGG